MINHPPGNDEIFIRLPRRCAPRNDDFNKWLCWVVYSYDNLDTEAMNIWRKIKHSLPIYIGVMSIMLIGLSCNKDCECECENEYNNNTHYVKYEAGIASPNGRIVTANIIVDTEVGEKTYTAKSFSEVFGPFPNGVKVYIIVSNNTKYDANTSAKIYVSTNNGPFILKASKSGTNRVVAEYTIVE